MIKRRKEIIGTLLGLMVVGVLGYAVGLWTMAEVWAVVGAVFVLIIVYFTTKKHVMLNASLSKIDKMTGEKFEEYLMYQFRKKRYRVKLTPVSGDFGADLIIRKYHRRYIVQAKRYQGSVGIKAVQEVIGAKEYYKIDRTIVVTNSYFTKAAKELAGASNVELWGRDEIIKEFRIKC